MDEKLKHRIVGGIVLFSVGLIVIPMLFSEDETKKVAISDAVIPPNPQANIKTIEMPLADKWADKSMPDVVPKPIVSAQETSPSQLVTSPFSSSSAVKEKVAEPKPAIAPPTKVVEAEPKPKPEPVVAEKKPEPKPKPQVANVTPQPNLVTAPPSGKAWVVQVGSFSDRANAERLRNRLIRSGYRAFVSQSRTNNRTVVRVRVGPELVRANADKLSRKLQRELSMQTMVVEHR